MEKFPVPIFFSQISYFGEPARIGCDRMCNKAFGQTIRPYVGDLDGDTAEWLAEDELGDAPAKSGVIEGSCDKPQSLDEAHNTWCIRQCERSQISVIGTPEESIEIPDFSKRVPCNS